MIPSKINAYLGIQEEDHPDGRSILRLSLRPEFLNEAGLTHGGIIALLVDGAMGRTVLRAMPPEESAATVQISFQFIRAASGTLTAEASITKKGKRLIFVDGFCRSESGEIVARAQGTWSVGQRNSHALETEK